MGLCLYSNRDLTVYSLWHMVWHIKKCNRHNHCITMINEKSNMFNNFRVKKYASSKLFQFMQLQSVYKGFQ